MRKINVLTFIFILTYSILQTSCDNEIRSIQNDYISQKEAFLLGGNYLKLNENRTYSFTMTEKEAERLNISKKDYDMMLNDIYEANEFIKKQVEKKINLVLFDPESIENKEMIIENTNRIRLKSGSESEPTTYLGNITTNDQNWGTTQIFIPFQINRIKITCNSVGFLQGFNVYVGGISSSGIGYIGTWSTDITPSYSNTYENCGFKTTNSNGGTCNFSGYTAP